MSLPFGEQRPSGANSLGLMRLDLRSLTVPFLVLGFVCVVAGGLVAAVTAPIPSEKGAWAAAYLVLVGGVAQLGLGLGQDLLAARPVTCRVGVAELLTWNVGNAAVLGGTLLDLPAITDAGGVLLVVTLGLAEWQVRRTDRATPLVRNGFRTLVAIVLVSIPVGLVLAHVRAG